MNESSLQSEYSSLLSRSDQVQWTIFGRVRSISSINQYEWLYAGFGIIGLIICLALTIERIASNALDSSDFTFAVVLLLTVVFCFYYVIHSVLTERWDELVVFVLGNIIVLLYTAMSFISGGAIYVKEIRLIIACIMCPLLIGFGIYMCIYYYNSNNLIVNTVGTNADLQKACKWFFICSTLLEFDLQLQLTMVALVMGSEGIALDKIQKSILSSGTVLSLFFFILGFLVLRKENLTMLIIFYIIGILEPGYITSKFTYTLYYDKSDSIIYATTFVCGSLAMVVWLALMICTAYYAKHYFGRGLREMLHGRQMNVAINTSQVGESSEA